MQLTKATLPCLATTVSSSGYVVGASLYHRQLNYRVLLTILATEKLGSRNSVNSREIGIDVKN
jgi:hypothetical protein